MIQRLRKHHISFKNAISGVVWALRTQPNFRVHLFLSIVVLFFAEVYQIQTIEKLILIFTILLGFTVEMLNTAIESITDLITTEWRQQAKIAKDVSAGMMLIVAIGAVIIAAYIFAPYML